jgi:hypothetical protein
VTAPQSEGGRGNPDTIAAHSAYIDQLLDFEADRRRSLQQRGVGVVTTSAAVATLYFGIVAGVYTASPGSAVRHAPWEVTLTIVFFALASLFGILSNMSGFAHRDQALSGLRRWYPLPADADSDPVAIPRAEEHVGDADTWVLANKVDLFRSEQAINKLRALAVAVALLFELCATVWLGVVVVTVVRH